MLAGPSVPFIECPGSQSGAAESFLMLDAQGQEVNVLWTRRGVEYRLAARERDGGRGLSTDFTGFEHDWIGMAGRA